MNLRVIPVFLLTASLVATAGLARAEKADRDKPMNIEADALRYDDVKQVSVFTGAVVVTKGTIVIRGARVEVRQDPEGYQFGLVTAAPDKLAFFRQKREAADEFVEGEGELIEYDSKADTVRLIRRAQLRRYLGPTVNDEMTGELIVYNNGTDVFTVNGAVRQPGTPASADSRIRAMLTPRNAASAPRAAASATLPTVPPLRPSTTLGGERK
ncbi:MAG: lipopolysaccharide transport periplasmic protein LptA [Burkholderiales bacterium]|nr:lipopolysaccharide transport periplasmic protein LptA [Burkholderiales bacterium]